MSPVLHRDECRGDTHRSEQVLNVVGVGGDDRNIAVACRSGRGESDRGIDNIGGSSAGAQDTSSPSNLAVERNLGEMR